ncbi:unnamed protein product [Durusdinium trenchii]|uniref:Uncharacterized protein n=1 Tax=Durusdinium trenchii TaxID=1381693 RepID=A0ABP0SNH6_9DINO
MVEVPGLPKGMMPTTEAGAPANHLPWSVSHGVCALKEACSHVVPEWVPVPVPPAPRVVERVVPERLPAPLRAVSPMVARVAPVAPSSPTDAQALKPPKKKKKLKTGEIEERSTLRPVRTEGLATLTGEAERNESGGLAADGTTRGEGSAMKLWKSECFANSPAYEEELPCLTLAPYLKVIAC